MARNVYYPYDFEVYKNLSQAISNFSVLFYRRCCSFPSHWLKNYPHKFCKGELLIGCECHPIRSQVENLSKKSKKHYFGHVPNVINLYNLIMECYIAILWRNMAVKHGSISGYEKSKMSKIKNVTNVDFISNIFVIITVIKI